MSVEIMPMIRDMRTPNQLRSDASSIGTLSQDGDVRKLASIISQLCECVDVYGKKLDVVRSDVERLMKEARLL